jgi:tetratricopeptide (TPR) repeat protein
VRVTASVSSGRRTHDAAVRLHAAARAEREGLGGVGTRAARAGGFERVQVDGSEAFLSQVSRRAAEGALRDMVNELLADAERRAGAGRYQEAVGIVAGVVRAAPGSASSARALRRLLPLALVGLEGPEREAVLAEFPVWAERLGGERDGAQARLLVLREHYRDGEFTRARAGLAALLRQEAARELAPRARLLLALATWRGGDRQAAIELLRRLTQEMPDHAVAPRAQFLAGYLLFVGGERRAAHAALLRVIERHPDTRFAAKAAAFLGREAAKRADVRRNPQ